MAMVIITKPSFNVANPVLNRTILYTRRELGQLTWYNNGMDGRGSIPAKGKRFFYTPQRPDRLWVPPSLLTNGSPRTLSSGVKWSGRDADY
jgi:hypothetical protein